MIIFSRHSLLKLKQRNIGLEAVRKTLRFPDRTSSGYSDRTIAWKKLNGAYLKVVYRIENKNIIVITQHWTKKFKT